MRPTSWIAITMTSVLLAGGCQSVKNAGTAAPVPLSRPASMAPRLQVMGVAQAPASLITNNGSSVIANNGSALVAGNAGRLVTNGASNMRSVLATEESAPVADAEVVALDENDQPLPGVKPTRTGPDGRFTLENVPSDGNVQVVVKKRGYSLTTLVRPSSGGKPVSVTPASTLVAAHLKKELAQDKKALKKVSESKLAELTSSIEEALSKGDVPLDLTSADQALKGYEHVMTKHPELAQKGMAAVAEAHAAAKQEPAAPPADAPGATAPNDTAASQRPEDPGSQAGDPPANPDASAKPSAPASPGTPDTPGSQASQAPATPPSGDGGGTGGKGGSDSGDKGGKK